MVYIALLRGINVGGNNKVEMKRLREVAEKLGFENVKTYINSGNLMFKSGRKASDIVKDLERAIEEEFGFYVKVLVRDLENLKKVAKAIPKQWVNDKEMKCDVMFLWEEVDGPKVLEEIKTNPQVDDIKYTSGAVLWKVDRKNYGKSGMNKFIGTRVYKNMTARNCNTVRKLVELMAS